MGLGIVREGFTKTAPVSTANIDVLRTGTTNLRAYLTGFPGLFTTGSGGVFHSFPNFNLYSVGGNPLANPQADITDGINRYRLSGDEVVFDDGLEIITPFDTANYDLTTPGAPTNASHGLVICPDGTPGGIPGQSGDILAIYFGHSSLTNWVQTFYRANYLGWNIEDRLLSGAFIKPETVLSKFNGSSFDISRHTAPPLTAATQISDTSTGNFTANWTVVSGTGTITPNANVPLGDTVAFEAGAGQPVGTQVTIRGTANTGAAIDITLVLQDDLTAPPSNLIPVVQDGVNKRQASTGETIPAEFLPPASTAYTVGTGTVLPDATTTELFRLIGHTTLPDGLYYSNGTNWVQS